MNNLFLTGDEVVDFSTKSIELDVLLIEILFVELDKYFLRKRGLIFFTQFISIIRRSFLNVNFDDIFYDS